MSGNRQMTLDGQNINNCWSSLMRTRGFTRPAFGVYVKMSMVKHKKLML